MKMNKSAWFSILLTLGVISMLIVLLVNGTFFKSPATTPAQPWENALVIAFMAALAVWCLAGAAGWIILFRRGFFATQLEHMAAGFEWLGCVLGLFLLAGLWVIAVLPGPYLLWFATTRLKRPICPQCKNWMPYGATRCAHCGAAAPPEPAAPQPAAPVVAIPPLPPSPAVGHVCEKCHSADSPGAVYAFHYGTFAGSEYLGKQRTQYNFKIAGTQEVFLCDRCVAEFGKKRSQRLVLITTLGMAALVVAIWGCGLAMQAINPGAENQVDVMPAAVILALMCPLLLFMVRRQRLKTPLGQGDLLAIELYRPALKQQGYTQFFTRQQVRDRNLI